MNPVRVLSAPQPALRTDQTASDALREFFRETPGATRAAPRRYELSTTTRDGRELAEPLWARALRARFGHIFSDTPAGRLALDLMCTSKLKSTVQSYDGKLLQFFEFCADTGRDPLRCQPLDVVEYVSWQGLRGRIHASNLQPYIFKHQYFL